MTYISNDNYIRMQRRKLNLNIVFTTIVFIIVCILIVVFPKFKFKELAYNTYSEILWNLFLFYFLIILIKFFNKAKNFYVRYGMIILLSLFSIFLLMSVSMKLLKIDPPIYYHDIETLYFNKKNKFDKIEKQYYVNWKSNKNDTVINRIQDYGLFREFIEYEVDTTIIDGSWIKASDQ